MEAVVESGRAGKLARVATFEAANSRGIFRGLLRWVGKTSVFAAVYRRIGPPLDTWLQRTFKGSVTGKLYGMPALLLVAKGARSGLPRASPLLYVREGEDFVVVGTNFGQKNHPAWTNNLMANPRAHIEVGPEKLEVEAEIIEEKAFAAQWKKLCEVYPGYAGYVARSGRTPRMFRLKPI